MNNLKQLPAMADPESEQAVLGAVILEPEALLQVADLLAPEHFEYRRHALIYQVMLDLKSSGQPVDLTTVTGTLIDRGQMEDAGGPVFLAELTEHVGTAANIEHYARRMLDKYLIRQVRRKARDILAMAERPGITAEDLLDFAESGIYAVFQEVRHKEPVPVGALVAREMERLEEITRTQAIPGIKTGYFDMDRIVGMQSGDVVILAGRPSMGKTALGLNVALKVAGQGKQVVFFSLEMSEEQLARRIKACEANIGFERINMARLTPMDWVALHEAHERIEALPLRIDDTPAQTLTMLRSTARRIKVKHGLDLLIIDYLQLIRAKKRGRSREEEVAEISRGLKATAKELEIPILVLAQLNREVEKRPNKRPKISDLRESGALEQDADVVMFIYRDEVYNPETTKDSGVAEILISKQRNGRTGKVKLAFLDDVQRFENLAR